MPCEVCTARNSACDYDAFSDQRRKVANQRNVQDLAQAQHDLERARQLLGGMVAILRAGTLESTMDLAALIKTGTDLSSLAAYVRNEVRAHLAVERAFLAIDFHSNGHFELPSPTQLLNRMGVNADTADSHARASAVNTDRAFS